MFAEWGFGTWLFLICFFWGFAVGNDTVFQLVILNQQDFKNILVLQNTFEKTRKQMKVNTLSINALSDNLNFPMFAKLILKKT